MPMPLEAPVISAVFLLVFIREEYVLQEPEHASNTNQCGHRIAGCRRGIRADEAAAHARNTFSDEARRRRCESDLHSRSERQRSAARDFALDRRTLAAFSSRRQSDSVQQLGLSRHFG